MLQHHREGVDDQRKLRSLLREKYECGMRPLLLERAMIRSGALVLRDGVMPQEKPRATLQQRSKGKIKSYGVLVSLADKGS